MRLLFFWDDVNTHISPFDNYQLKLQNSIGLQLSLRFILSTNKQKMLGVILPWLAVLLKYLFKYIDCIQKNILYTLVRK